MRKFRGDTMPHSGMDGRSSNHPRQQIVNRGMQSLDLIRGHVVRVEDDPTPQTLAPPDVIRAIHEVARSLERPQPIPEQRPSSEL